MAFRNAGGGELHLIPCLNEHPRWIAALSELAWRNLGGLAGRRCPMRRSAS